jgi:Fe-S-cluster containining protein
MTIECSCDRCQAACTVKPGWFKPGEIAPVAKFLNLTEQELFDRYLGVDWWEAGYCGGRAVENDIFLLAPAITSMSPGSEYPGDPHGTCVFLKDGRCEIHEVKPYECKKYFHGSKHEEINFTRSEIVRLWETEQAKIIELLDREPISENYFNY